MNRVEIKEKAKEMIKGNLWKIWKPTLALAAISSCITFVIALIIVLCGAKVELATGIASSIVSLMLVPTYAGVCAYYLKFVRGEELSLNIIKKYYPFFVKLFILDLLITIFTLLWSILLVIPGIIAAISYSMSYFIAVDKEELTATETIKESKRIMNGHKLDFFILQLSFIGWELLMALTLGILAIWVIPYMTISEVLFYESIREKA